MLALDTFHHVTMEVGNVEQTKEFYKALLGLEEVRRPNLNCNGSWLEGLGVHVHLIETQKTEEYEISKRRRFERFQNEVPFVEHFAFIAHDINQVEQVLKAHRLVYVRRKTNFGANQIFLLDPDGHVIEFVDCAPRSGEIRCVPDSQSSESGDERA